jgi:hypothetical protein
MAVYPSFSQMTSSKEVQLMGREIDRATNGAPRARSFYSAPKKVFNIVHGTLTSAEKATLESFFAANALTTFNFVWAGDGNSYSVIFGNQDLQFAPAFNVKWAVNVQLLQV